MSNYFKYLTVKFLHVFNYQIISCISLSNHFIYLTVKLFHVYNYQIIKRIQLSMYLSFQSFYVPNFKIITVSNCQNNRLPNCDEIFRKCEEVTKPRRIIDHIWSCEPRH